MKLFARFDGSARRTAPRGAPLSPYGEGSQITASFLAQERRIVRGALWVAAAGIGVALVFAWLFLEAATRSTVAVHVVEVDTLGAVRNVQPAETVYVPSDAAIKKQLSDFLVAVRGLSVDPVVMGERVRWAEAVVTPRAGELLRSAFDANPPEARFGTEATQIDIVRTLRSQGQGSFDVAWKETTVQLPNNQPLRSVIVTGLFTVIVRQPKNDYEVQVNPLGIWIDHFAIEKPAQ